MVEQEKMGEKIEGGKELKKVPEKEKRAEVPAEQLKMADAYLTVTEFLANDSLMAVKPEKREFIDKLREQVVKEGFNIKELKEYIDDRMEGKSLRGKWGKVIKGMQLLETSAIPEISAEALLKAEEKHNLELIKKEKRRAERIVRESLEKKLEIKGKKVEVAEFLDAKARDLEEKYNVNIKDARLSELIDFTVALTYEREEEARKAGAMRPTKADIYEQVTKKIELMQDVDEFANDIVTLNIAKSFKEENKETGEISFEELRERIWDERVLVDLTHEEENSQQELKKTEKVTGFWKKLGNFAKTPLGKKAFGFATGLTFIFGAVGGPVDTYNSNKAKILAQFAKEPRLEQIISVSPAGEGEIVVKTPEITETKKVIKKKEKKEVKAEAVVAPEEKVPSIEVEEITEPQGLEAEKISEAELTGEAELIADVHNHEKVIEDNKYVMAAFWETSYNKADEAERLRAEAIKEKNPFKLDESKRLASEVLVCIGAQTEAFERINQEQTAINADIAKLRIIEAEKKMLAEAESENM